MGGPSGERERLGGESSKGSKRSKSRQPTPGPGHYNPEHPAVRGRIPGRVLDIPNSEETLIFGSDDVQISCAVALRIDL